MTPLRRPDHSPYGDDLDVITRTSYGHHMDIYLCWWLEEVHFPACTGAPRTVCYCSYLCYYLNRAMRIGVMSWVIVFSVLLWRYLVIYVVLSILLLKP